MGQQPQARDEKYQNDEGARRRHDSNHTASTSINLWRKSSGSLNRYHVASTLNWLPKNTQSRHYSLPTELLLVQRGQEVREMAQQSGAWAWTITCRGDNSLSLWSLQTCRQWRAPARPRRKPSMWRAMLGQGVPCSTAARSI